MDVDGELLVVGEFVKYGVCMGGGGLGGVVGGGYSRVRTSEQH